MTEQLPPLVITATPNKSWLSPEAPYPEGIAAVADEARKCSEAGAAIIHLHSVTEWPQLVPAVRDVTDALIQCGMSSVALEGRLDIYRLHADMISIIANHHDEAFPEGNTNVLHEFGELVRYCELGMEYNVRPEFEIWHTGSIWNLLRLLERTEIAKPLITTLFFGWPGGTWSPPTIEEYLTRRRMMPEDSVVTVSVMGPQRYGILSAAITSGDHVRVGTEDYAFDRWGNAAQASDLVAEVVQIAESLGRSVAGVTEAGALLSISTAARSVAVRSVENEPA